MKTTQNTIFDVVRAITVVSDQLTIGETTDQDPHIFMNTIKQQQQKQHQQQ